MAYQAGTTFVPVIPSFAGWSKAMNKGTIGASVKAGQAAGATFGKGFSSRAAAGASGVAEAQERIAASVKAASAQVKVARSAEEDATRKARIEEANSTSSELRASGKAKTSQILAAENRLILAHKALGTAAGKAEVANQDLDDAIARGVRELKEAETAAGKTGRSFRGLGAGIKAATGAAGRNAFSNLPSLAGKAGSAAARQLSSTLSSGLGGSGGLLAGAVGGVAKIAAGGALAIGAIGAAGIGAGAKTAAGMETAKIGFETMLGSAEKADKFLRDLQKFAATTRSSSPSCSGPPRR